MVEACLTLDIDQMVCRRILQPGARTRGVMSWNDQHGRVVSSISYWADLVDAGTSWLRFLFKTPDVRTGQPRQVDQRVPLTTINPYLGGERWWFHIFDSCAYALRYDTGPRFSSRRL